MHVRRGREGQHFPCNLCHQWRFSGNTGFSSTINNPFLWQVQFQMSYFYFNRPNLFCSSVLMLSLNRWPRLCGEPLQAAGNMTERGQKPHRVGERGAHRTPWGSRKNYCNGERKENNDCNGDLMQAEDRRQAGSESGQKGDRRDEEKG